MDDQFMHSAWRTPRADFARQVLERLRHLDSTQVQPRSADRGHAELPRGRGDVPRGQGDVHRMPRRLLRFAACVAAVGLVVGAFGLPSVQAGARAFLDLFRVVNLAPVSVQQGRIDALMEKHGLDLPRMMGDQVQVLKDPGARQTVASAKEAGDLAGIHVRTPSWLPVGLEPQAVDVMGDQVMRVTANTQKLKRVLDTLGIEDLTVPENVDGQSATVHVPAVVRMTYRDKDHSVALLQARQPEATLPAGLDLATLGEIGLRVLGVQPTEAHRFAQNVDWRTTLIIPVPADVSVFRQVDIRGNAGLLIETARRTARGVLPVESRILWSAGDSVYALVGDVRPAELFEMAQSIQ